MHKRFLAATLAAAILLLSAGLFLTQSAAPVSAQQLLAGAQAAEVAARSAIGIRHYRTESIVNPNGSTDPKATTHTIIDSYHDGQTGNMRTVTADGISGRVIGVYAYDGMYTYSSREPINNTDPLTIYRSPQDKNKLVDIQGGDISGNASKLFSVASMNAGVSVSGPQPGANGKAVYSVTTQGPVKFTVINGIITQTAQTVITFDAQNYRILGSQMTMAQNGQVINLNTQKVLIDELLPDGTKIAWDLSDLHGVKIVDDADRSKGDLLPEVVQRQDLAAKTQNAYLLKYVPAGMVLVISAPPKQENESTYIFVATYRSTNSEDYVTIQSGDAPASLAGMTDEQYTTQTGLVLAFLKSRTAPDGKTFNSAVVSAPDGTRFMLNSTLPRERVKQLAETLDRVR